MTNTNLIQNNDSHLTVNDLQVIEDEPRIKDVVLGERLGLKRAVKIKEVIEANIKEIQGFGSCPLQTDTMKVGCVVRPVKTYYLNEAKPKPLSGFAPNIKDCQLITITTGCLNKTLNIGEIAVAAKVEGFRGAGIYAIHRMDYKPELYRCIETVNGQIKMSRDNGEPDFFCSLKHFNELSTSKLVAVFRNMDNCTEAYKELQKFMFVSTSLKSRI